MFDFDWSKVWQFVFVGALMALIRTIVSRSHRTWDSFVANVLAACVIAPLAGLAVVEWLDNPKTPWVEGMAFAFVSATAVAFLGVDLLRGLLHLGEAFAKDPVGILKGFGSLWIGNKK